MSWRGKTILCLALGVGLGLGFAVNLSWFSVSWGQTSRKLMNLQGRLTNTEGDPTGGPHLFELRIFDAGAAGSGTQLYYEAQRVEVNKGIYNVLVGEGYNSFTGNDPDSYTPAGGQTGGIPASVFNRDNLWLEIEIDEDNPLDPRTRVVSSAYAFNADTLDGKDSTAFLQAGSDAALADVQVNTLSFVGGGELDSASVGQLLAGTSKATPATTVAAGQSLTLNHNFGTLDVISTGWYQDGSTWTAIAPGAEAGGGVDPATRKNVAQASNGGSILASSSHHSPGSGKYYASHVIDGGTDCNDQYAKYHSADSSTAYFQIGFNAAYVVDQVKFIASSESGYNIPNWTVDFSDGTRLDLSGVSVCNTVTLNVAPPVSTTWVKLTAKSNPSYSSVTEIQAFGGTALPIQRFKITQDPSNVYLLNDSSSPYLLRLVAGK